MFVNQYVFKINSVRGPAGKTWSTVKVQTQSLLHDRVCNTFSQLVVYYQVNSVLLVLYNK